MIVYPPPYFVHYGKSQGVRPVKYARPPYGTTQAVATVTVVAKAAFQAEPDSETLTINDGIGSGDVVFEFDVNGDGVGGGNVQVDISADTTAEDVRDTLLAAMLTVFPATAAIQPVASPTDTDEIILNHLSPGESGNAGTVAEDVDAAGFLTSNFSGGLDGNWNAVRIGPWLGLMPSTTPAPQV